MPLNKDSIHLVILLIENEDNKLKIVKSFREQLSLERELNALILCMDGINKVDESELNEKGITKDFFNTFFERSKDITIEDIKSTWTDLLRVEIEIPNTISIGIMNLIENLDKETIRNFNRVGKYIFNDFIINVSDDDLKLYRTNHMQLIDFQDSGLVMQTHTKFTINKNIRGFYSYDLRPTSGLIISAVFQTQQSFTGYTLTRAGKVIKSLIGGSEENDYINRLVEYMKSKGSFLISYSNHNDNVFKELYVSDNIDAIITK